MNLKEIAELSGKSERQIRYWLISASNGVKYTRTDNQPETVAVRPETVASLKQKVNTSRETNHSQDYVLEEVIAIVRAGGNETLANLLSENASKGSQQIAGDSGLTNRDLDLISAIVARTVAATTEILSGRLYNIESQIEKRKALLPAPEIKARDAINKLVREYATKTEMPFNSIWNKVYTEFNYTYKCNVKTSAYNRDMTVIDYIETEGMIEQLLAVAVRTLTE